MANRRYKYGRMNIEKLETWDAAAKEENINMYVTYMFSRTMRFFRYDDLPDSIPRRSIELYNQVGGFSGWADYKDTLYVFHGGLGGEPSPYYMPTEFLVSNPALKMSERYKIDENCVIMPNDSMYFGLLPMFVKYATQMVENDLSLTLADINLRVQALLSAPDETTRASAEKFLEEVYKGKLGIIGEAPIFDGLKVAPYGSSANYQLQNLIEYHQYLRASWYNEIGLQCNYNMKRESINSNEAQMNEDALLPLIDDMLECRREAIDKINKMFGTNIKVNLDSAWKENRIELELEHQELDAASEIVVDSETVKGVEDETKAELVDPVGDDGLLVEDNIEAGDEPASEESNESSEEEETSTENTEEEEVEESSEENEEESKGEEETEDEPDKREDDEEKKA